MGIVKTQLSNPSARLVLIRDLDAMTEKEMVEDVGSKLNSLGLNCVGPLKWHFRLGLVLSLVPVGLPDDPDLKLLGIKRHTSESHLLRLLFDHPEKCIHERTGNQIDNPKDLLKEILPTARSHDPPLDSAKDVFQVLRGVLGWTGGPHDWLPKLLRDISVESEPAFESLCRHLRDAILETKP